MTRKGELLVKESRGWGEAGAGGVGIWGANDNCAYWIG